MSLPRTWNEVFDALVQIAYRQKDVLSASKARGNMLLGNIRDTYLDD